MHKVNSLEVNFLDHMFIQPLMHKVSSLEVHFLRENQTNGTRPKETASIS